jgi:hypothetical protein
MELGQDTCARLVLGNKPTGVRPRQGRASLQDSGTTEFGQARHVDGATVATYPCHGAPVWAGVHEFATLAFGSKKKTFACFFLNRKRVSKDPDFASLTTPTNNYREASQEEGKNSTTR